MSWVLMMKALLKEMSYFFKAFDLLFSCSLIGCLFFRTMISLFNKRAVEGFSNIFDIKF